MVYLVSIQSSVVCFNFGLFRINELSLTHIDDVLSYVLQKHFFLFSSYEKSLSMKEAMSGDREPFIVMMICISQFGSCGKPGYAQRYV
jgi:hypothetical protein